MKVQDLINEVYNEFKNRVNTPITGINLNYKQSYGDFEYTIYEVVVFINDTCFTIDFKGDKDLLIKQIELELSKKGWLNEKVEITELVA